MKLTQTNEDEITLQKIVLHLKKNKGVIAFITFLVGILSAIYAYLLPPTYSSSVTIAFSNPQISKLASMLPDDLASHDSELRTAKLTLKTRKFIKSIIDEIDISQRYFIKKDYRKEEVNQFSDMNISLTIKNKALYNQDFELEPVDKNHFHLKIKSIDFIKLYSFNTDINEHDFFLKVIKGEKLKENIYIFKVLEEASLVQSVVANIQVQLLSENVINVLYHDTVAQRAKEVVDKIANNFIQYTLNRKTSEFRQTLAFLDAQIAESKNHLNYEGNRLKNYRQQSKTFISEDTNKVVFSLVTTKKEELQVLKFRLHELKNFKKSIARNEFNTVSLLESGTDISSIQSLIENFRADMATILEMKLQLKNIRKLLLTSDSQLASLIQSLNQEEILLENLRFNFTAGHPQVIEVNNNIVKLEEDIRGYLNVNIKKLRERTALLKGKILSNILMTEKSLESRVSLLKKELKEKEGLLYSLPEKELNIQNIKRKFTLSENIYTFLLQKKMELDISKASIVVNTQIIEDPIIPHFPIKPNRKMIVIIGIVIGFFLGILITVLRSMFDTKIRDIKTISELTDVPVYGQLPFKKNRRFFEEALRNIRTNLQFVLPKEQECTCLLISSITPGEGKTTVVAGLGDIIAKTGKRVLLMDLDLRKPRLFKEIKKSNKIGVTQYLVENLALEELIQPIDETLDFLPAGAIPPNPSELLMSNKFKEMMNILMEQYDYIIFDTPPIGAVIDANMLIEYSDIFLLILKANVAEKAFLEKFNEMRAEKNIISSGIIFNQVKIEKSSNYGYASGYGYGYGDAQSKRRG